MFASLRARLWLSYALMIATALTVVAVVLFLYLLNNPLLHRQALNRVRTAEGLIVQRAPELVDPWNPAALQRITQTLEVRVLVFAADQSLSQDTAAGSPALAFPRRTLLGRAGSALEDASGDPWLYTLRRLPGRGWLMVAAPQPRVPVLNVLTDELLSPMLQGALVALALSLILAFLVARWIADPLQRVVTAARGFPAGGPQIVQADGPREVQDLTRAFNSMVARVQASQRSQRDFVANVSHELKTPLTSIQGFAQALLDGTADTTMARRQAAEVIQAEAGRMHRMVLDLLDLARLESGTADLEISRLEAAGLLGGIAEKFAPQAARAGVALQLDLPSDLPAFRGDGDRLAQVFSNLVDNALKFTPAGGTVTIRAAAGDDEIHFEVQDTGQGISEADQGRVFDRFYQADAARPGGTGRGSGLGLAIVREIVAAHSGRISVRSRPGLGTIFRFSLPLAPSADTLRIHRKR